MQYLKSQTSHDILYPSDELEAMCRHLIEALDCSKDNIMCRVIGKETPFVLNLQKELKDKEVNVVLLLGMFRRALHPAAARGPPCALLPPRRVSRSVYTCNLFAWRGKYN
jgi:hypothetical protein